VGRHYETTEFQAGTTPTPYQGTTKYYIANGQAIALRREGYTSDAAYGLYGGNALHYRFSDHLGSSHVTYRSDGGQTLTQRYSPWGTIRPGPANLLPTDVTFTGQRLDESVGLMYYSNGAGYGRYYDPTLGRWTQPDPIVPNPGNPQGLNRYSYVNNRPTVLNDPDGHCGPLCAALYALGESFVGAGVGAAGGDLYDPATGQPCGDTGCVTPNRSHGEVAARVALDVTVAETGGRLVNKVIQKGAGLFRKVLQGGESVDVRHATRAAQSVLNGIDPRFFQAEARFGKAFYVAEDGLTAALEAPGTTHVIRFRFDLGKARVLKLTDPEVAKSVGYVRNEAARAAHQAIARRARELGYNVIEYESYQSPGTINYAVLSDFDELLTPVMVSPIPDPLLP
jgi:RHS repeat-associated protein